MVSHSGVAIRREDISSPIVQQLISALNAELEDMYPEEGANHFRLDADEVAGRAVAKGALVGGLGREAIAGGRSGSRMDCPARLTDAPAGRPLRTTKTVTMGRPERELDCVSAL